MKLEPTVIHEDADLVVINKPAGLMVHGDGRFTGETLVDWVRTRYPEMEGVGEALSLGEAAEDEDDTSVIDRPGIVHRLDRDTSGVMLLARTAIAHGRLKKQFMNRGIKKTYRAFVYGRLKEERGTIDRPIGKSRSDFRQWSAQRGSRGVMREARTDYRTILRTPSVSYVEAFPQTGRTHQIRVHFKAIQHPIVCDSLYAAGKPPALGFKRLALHAFSISFTHPGTGKAVRFEAPLPAEFLAAEKELRASS
jgi:23S rRNA pseudouridine1911/1915/1917 synthase